MGDTGAAPGRDAVTSVPVGVGYAWPPRGSTTSDSRPSTVDRGPMGDTGAAPGRDAVPSVPDGRTDWSEAAASGRRQSVWALVVATALSALPLVRIFWNPPRSPERPAVPSTRTPTRNDVSGHLPWSLLGGQRSPGHRGGHSRTPVRLLRCLPVAPAHAYSARDQQPRLQAHDPFIMLAGC